MQFDNVQLEVLHQAVDVEEVAHEGHQAVTWSSESKGQDFSGGTLQVGGKRREHVRLTVCETIKEEDVKVPCAHFGEHLL